MRLDKYLKLSRLIKRRTVANEFCDAGCVLIQGRPAKASAEVKVGDEITMRFGNRTLVVKVELVPTRAPSVQEAPTLYSTLSEVWNRPDSAPPD